MTAATLPLAEPESLPTTLDEEVPATKPLHTIDDDSHMKVFVKQERPSVEATQREGKVVRFSVVEIREYERIVGDHPDCKVGPPLSLGWNYLAREPLSIDDYEKDRFRRPNRHLIMTSITRQNILMTRFGYSEEELEAGEKEAARVRKQRERTRNQGKMSRQAEDVLFSARRVLKRTLSRERIFAI